MSQSNFSSQKEFKSTEQEKSLQVCKLTLEHMQNELEPGPSLRQINKGEILSFIEELAKVSEQVNNLKSTPSINPKNIQLADAIGSIHPNLKKAIIELSLALDLLDWGDKLETRDVDIGLNARRDFYECLNNCQDYIREAIRQLAVIEGA